MSNPDRLPAEQMDEGDIVTVESFEQAVDFAAKTFRLRLKKRFTAGEADADVMDYHAPEHSEGVAEEAQEFLRIIQRFDPTLVSDRDIVIAGLQGLAHDLVQKATITPEGMRIRHRGFYPEDITEDDRLRTLGYEKGNEELSADEFVAELARYRYADGTSVFGMDDPATREEYREDIGTTFPKFTPDATLPDGSQGFKVYQPHLTPRSTLRGLALATADLRGEVGGRRTFKSFRKIKNKEYKESNVWVGNELENGIENVGPEMRTKITGSMVDWITKSQVTFPQWQKELLRQSLDENLILKGRTDIQNAIIERYNFEEIIEGSQTFAKGIETQADAVIRAVDKRVGEEFFRNLVEEFEYAT